MGGDALVSTIFSVSVQSIYCARCQRWLDVTKQIELAAGDAVREESQEAAAMDVREKLFRKGRMPV